jgi:putative transposase
MKSVSNKDYNIEYKQKQYKHLNIKERVKIETMMNDQLEVYGKVNITKIAQKLNRSKSTISREIRRNRFVVVTEVFNKDSIFKKKKVITFEYESTEANEKALKKQKEKGTSRIKLLYNKQLIKEVNRLLKEEGKSPDIVAYKIRENKTFNVKVSTNTIYDGIRKGYLEVSTKDRKRMKDKSRRCRVERNKIPESKKDRSIELRPDYINNRKEFGHFEMDLVLGKQGKDKECLLTLTERKTRFEIVIKLNNKSSSEVIRAINSIKEHLKGYSSEIFKSITTDNGSEFSRYEEIEEILGTMVYFCHPGASYEKGTNERHNGMLREYIPKGSDISKYSAEDLDRIVSKLNDLERKKLNYYTPYMKILEEYDSIEGTELLFNLQTAVNN